MSQKAGRIYVGVGGWSYAPWREAFYPAGLPHKRELEYASHKLTSIEINATYYRTQSAASFAKWRDETPEGFIFSVKAPRFAAMRKTPKEASESIERFLKSGVMELGDKLGPILWQFLPTKKFDAAFFDAFLSLLPKNIGGRPLRHAIEPRHNSFKTAEFVALARRHGVAIVVAGDAKYPLIADLTAPFVYARIMGTLEAEPQGYDAKALDAWARRARQWASGASPSGLDYFAETQRKAATPRDVFLYVISGAKERNPAAAMALIERLSR
ncbi:DUF72 domain-containing protein [Methylocystis sp. SC2]|uniref:DUF72 domain-containing protein n=1 Tax=Methylocystis sp. (strain SC2) TaxID=187303 RepID=UPI00027AF196|nr:DUF72 domain-containing protein [Methylocystis sp. SC2]CCJ05940.1 Conserved hypothetical protein [Methylocystis sp. SC2]